MAFLGASGVSQFDFPRAFWSGLADGEDAICRAVGLGDGGEVLALGLLLAELPGGVLTGNGAEPFRQAHVNGRAGRRGSGGGRLARHRAPTGRGRGGLRRLIGEKNYLEAHHQAGGHGAAHFHAPLYVCRLVFVEPALRVQGAGITHGGHGGHEFGERARQRGGAAQIGGGSVVGRAFGGAGDDARRIAQRLADGRANLKADVARVGHEVGDQLQVGRPKPFRYDLAADFFEVNVRVGPIGEVGGARAGIEAGALQQLIGAGAVGIVKGARAPLGRRGGLNGLRRFGPDGRRWAADRAFVQLCLRPPES